MIVDANSKTCPLQKKNYTEKIQTADFISSKPMIADFCYLYRLALLYNCVVEIKIHFTNTFKNELTSCLKINLNPLLHRLFLDHDIIFYY